MFSKTVITSAKFLKMPLETQALYFHLGLNADDDGVVEAYSTMRLLGANEDNLKVLAGKGFVKVLNEDLVSFIVDWREHNHIRADRKIDSIYQPLLLKIVDESALLSAKERADRVKPTSGTADGQPKDGIGKDRLGKDRLGKDRLGNLLVPKQVTNNKVLPKQVKNVTETGNLLVPKQVPTKETIQKKVNKDEILLPSNPIFIKDKTKKTKLKNNYDEIFEELWKIYPDEKRTRKADSYKEFKKTVKTENDKIQVKNAMYNYLIKYTTKSEEEKKYMIGMVNWFRNWKGEL